jgi:hypothetical protein
MFAKIVKGKDLVALETEVNKFIADLDISYHGGESKHLKIYNVQQFVIGEVDPSTVALVSRQPVPTYSFCLLLICGYE